jgi:thiol-disulfide isomerase/thioredoxin
MKNTTIMVSLMMTASCFAGKADTASPKAKNYEEITSRARYDEIIKSTEPRVIAFYKTTCGACDQMDPHLNEVAGKYKNKAKCYVIDLEKDAKGFGPLIKEHKLEGIPTTLFLKTAEVRRERGAMQKDELEHAFNMFINGPSGFVVEQPKKAEAPKIQTSHKVAQR